MSVSHIICENCGLPTDGDHYAFCPSDPATLASAKAANKEGRPLTFGEIEALANEYMEKTLVK